MTHTQNQISNTISKIERMLWQSLQSNGEQSLAPLDDRDFWLLKTIQTLENQPQRLVFQAIEDLRELYSLNNSQWSQIIERVKQDSLKVSSIILTTHEISIAYSTLSFIDSLLKTASIVFKLIGDLELDDHPLQCKQPFELLIQLTIKVIIYELLISGELRKFIDYFNGQQSA